MKNAYTLVAHTGDDGFAPKGRVLLEVDEKRFKALERQGLVRIATDDEVAAEKSAAKPENKMAPVPENKGA
ncbi:hypothetical protein CA223_06800 [Sphingomonas koreensis]|uniref:Mu-like prophage FluMu N-terminal domain-containing protein n=1 Tax=Sphingomonas koreensis TaxID=93064 RepID=A0A1L6J7V6_9SPHN|nr:hypothetical protein [Sphingomonas koreensis]APR51995.1 hypothetical protein BRX40_05680 [Sphingomonas koreensis]RSU22797.1 hypothetical protein CA224_05300 [Sphingomonas koreensis]RSU30729.1 hypothetical protein CA222_01245 [Sphingomonas koreensis]RSU31824.1 hypothetical protein CA225_00325 [Sphingomonas koreensis]RSU39255.1 hypothetical protein BRX39_01205 [Sphingomonas koreensis]